MMEGCYIISKSMSISQSKLMLQLAKEQKITQRPTFNEEVVEEIYSTICKLEPKNLMLVEFLSLVIEKDFIKNSTKLAQFVELYEEVRGKTLEQEHKAPSEEDLKFSKKKFIKLLKEMARRLYPGHPAPYETALYDRLTRTDSDDHRMRLDDSIRKMLTKETVGALNELDRQLQTVFEIYMPENYNLGLDFGWDEIKVLEKRLPIVCFLKFLFEAEVVPHALSPGQFLEVVSKLKPPALPNSGSSKEAMFYTSETLAAYVRDHLHLPTVRLLEGDLGLTFFEMQVLFVKLATEFSRDTKGEFPASIRKLAAYMHLKEAFEETAPRKNKLMETVRAYLRTHSSKTDKIVLKKRESKKKIEDLYDSKEVELKEEAAKNVYRNMAVEPRQMELIKKDLDSELAEVPPKRKIDKENEGYFDVEKKHVVIGQQLPKIQDKNKPAAPKEAKKKNDDGLQGYKPQSDKPVEESNVARLLRRPKKLRVNTEYPIILNEVFYPSDLKAQLFIGAKAELYLQTSYIHLGQRLYEEAFLNFSKAKQFTDSKSSLTEFYYHIHLAQIFESAGRDDLSLSFYHKAKGTFPYNLDLLAVLTSLEGEARAHPYIGMGAALYHMEEYEYALRCFEKARSSYGPGLVLESVENAILQNNIGCCLMVLNRNQEAIRYFETSHHIFDLKAGCFDERTLVVQQNFNKNRKAYLEMLPQFKTMWKTYVEKSNTKLPSVRPPTKGKK